MIDLIGQVLRVQQQTGDKPIVIHCRFVSLHCVISNVCTEHNHYTHVYNTPVHFTYVLTHIMQVWCIF